MKQEGGSGDGGARTSDGETDGEPQLSEPERGEKWEESSEKPSAASGAGFAECRWASPASCAFQNRNTGQEEELAELAIRSCSNFH